jgi:hypothetical protein
MLARGILCRILIMGMVALDDVGRHELVKQSRNTLDTNETPNETNHHGQTGRLLGPFGLFKVFLGLG